MPTSVQNAPGLQVAATADNERDGRVVTDFARQETLDRILAQLRPLLPGALLVTPATLVSASCAKGAYVLLAHLTAAHAVRIRSAAWPLAAGWHIYVGSANGPGGMRARIGRHLRTDKTIHWHIDRLTVAVSTASTTGAS